MIRTTTLVAWLCVQAVYCQVTKNSCNVSRTEDGCAKRVICNLKDEVVREKREITISIRKDSGDETIADCKWVRSGEFDCDPATGYTCDPQLSVTFSVNITKPEKCVNSGEFLFEVAYEKPFSCQIGKPEHVISEVKINSDNASANGKHESLNKGPNSADENENGASGQENHTGMIIGVVFTCLLVGVGVLVVKRKTLVAFVRKLKGHEGKCVEASDYITAVKDFENKKCLIPETADSAKPNTLEEKDAVLEALNLRPGINYEVNTNIINIYHTEHDAAFDVSLAHSDSSCNGEDNDWDSSSKQT